MRDPLPATVDVGVARQVARASSWRRVALWGAAGAGLAVLPQVSASEYAVHVMVLSCISAVAATGLNLTNGYLGLLNLGPAAFVGLGGYTSAILALAGFPLWLAASGGILLAGITGFGVALAFLRMRGFFFALATLAVGEIVRLLALNLVEITRGPLGLVGIPRPGWGATLQSYYYLALGGLAVAVAVVGCVARSEAGLILRAIRENERKAGAVGIPVYKFKVMGFTVAAMIMALSGVLFAHYLEYLDPSIAGLRVTTETVLMVILGGRGTLLGPVVGAFLITLAPEVLRVAPALRLILYGSALVVAIMVIPEGVVGSIARRFAGGQEGRGRGH